MKIGFLGGSFDPVHFGHLMAAQDALEHGGLDRLMFVPAAQAPLKPGVVQASAVHRLAMLESALGQDDRFGISDYELRRGGISYTVETVRYFISQFPNDRLCWVVGEDQLSGLHRWKEIERLVGWVEFIVLGRPGHKWDGAPSIPGLRMHRCTGHLLEMSSTEIRERARRGLPLDYFMPHKTIEYVKETGLYR